MREREREGGGKKGDKGEKSLPLGASVDTHCFKSCVNSLLLLLLMSHTFTEVMLLHALSLIHPTSLSLTPPQPTLYLLSYFVSPTRAQTVALL